MSELERAVDMLKSGNPDLRQGIRDLVGYKNRVIKGFIDKGFLNLNCTFGNIIAGEVIFTFDTDGDFREFFDDDRGARSFELYTDVNNFLGNVTEGQSNPTGNAGNFEYDANNDKTSIIIAFGQGNIPNEFTGSNPTALFSGIKNPATQLDFDFIGSIVSGSTPITPSEPQLFKELSIAPIKGRDFRIKEILTSRFVGGSLALDLMRKKTAGLPGRYAKEKRALELWLEQFA